MVCLDEVEQFAENQEASVASLRRCSPSDRNGVRLPSGTLFSFVGIPRLRTKGSMMPRTVTGWSTSASPRQQHSDGLAPTDDGFGRRTALPHPLSTPRHTSASIRRSVVSPVLAESFRNLSQHGLTAAGIAARAAVCFQIIYLSFGSSALGKPLPENGPSRETNRNCPRSAPPVSDHRLQREISEMAEIGYLSYLSCANEAN